jgi:hypothetical protein
MKTYHSLIFVIFVVLALIFFHFLPSVNGEQISSNCRFGTNLCETNVSVNSITIGSANLRDQIIDMQIGGISISANHNFTAQIKVNGMPFQNFIIQNYTNHTNGWHYGFVNNIQGRNNPITQTINFWPFNEYSFDVWIYVYENVTSKHDDTIRTGFEQELAYQKIWQIEGREDSVNHDGDKNLTIFHDTVSFHYTDDYKNYNFFIAFVFIAIPVILILSHIFIKNLSTEKHIMIFLGAISVMVFVLFTVRQYVTSGYSLNETITSLITVGYGIGFIIFIYRKRRIRYPN